VVVGGRTGMMRCMSVDSVDIYLELLIVVLYFVMPLLMVVVVDESKSEFEDSQMQVRVGNDLLFRPVNRVTAKIYPCP